jgi:hypothetical protein
MGALSCDEPHLFSPTPGNSDDNQGGGEPPCLQPAELTPPSGDALLLHAVDVVDAWNLSLNDDGTFHGTLFGCDIADAFRGSWLVYGDAVVLLPDDGEELEWFDKVDPVMLVRLTRRDDGLVAAEAVREAGSTFMTLTEGRVCACCAELGPEALQPCDGPLPEEPGGSRIDCRAPCPP